MITAVVFLLFLGLIVFGPKKTIEIAQSIGRAVAQVKQATNQFQAQLHQDVRLPDKVQREPLFLGIHWDKHLTSRNQEKSGLDRRQGTYDSRISGLDDTSPTGHT